MGRSVHPERGKALVVPVLVSILSHGGRHVRVGVAHWERLCRHGRVTGGHRLVAASHGVDGIGRRVLVAPGGDGCCGVDVPHHSAVAGREHRGRCECLLELLLLLTIFGAAILEPYL